MIIAGSYMPGGIDTAFQIQAAQRLASGHGLTYISSYEEKIPDISSPKYVFLSSWPPGLSLLIFGFLTLGFNLFVSMLIINFLVTFFVLYTWSLIGLYYKLKKLELVAFLIAIFLIILIRNLLGMPDVFAIGIFALVFYRLIKYGLSNRNLLYIGLLSGIIIVFKFSALYILAGVSFYVIFSCIKDFRKVFTFLLVYNSIPLLVFLGIKLYSHFLTPGATSSGLSSQSFIASLSYLEYDWFFKFIKNVYLSTYRLDDGFVFVFAMIGLKPGVLFFYVLSTALFGLTILGFFRLQKKLPFFKDISALTTSMFLGGFFFLFLASGVHASPHWTPLETPRYILPIMPLLILFAIVFARQLSFNTQVVNSGYLSIFVFAVLLLVIRISHDISQINAFSQEKNLINHNIENIIKQYDDSAITIVFSDNFFRSMLFMDNQHHAIRDLSILTQENYFSQKTLVILIEKRTNRPTLSTYRKEEYEILNERRDNTLQEVLIKNKYGRVEENDFVLYYNLFP